MINNRIPTINISTFGLGGSTFVFANAFSVFELATQTIGSV